MALIDDIEKAALDSNVKIADALRMCIALGGKAGSTALRDWASKELNGYDGEDELPEYRIIPAAIGVEAAVPGGLVSNQRIAAHDLPDVAQEKGIDEEVRITSGIAEVEDLAAHPTGENIKISLPGGALLAKMMNYDLAQQGIRGQQITSLYWMASPTAFRGIVDRVRTALTELVAEMRSNTPQDQETPSAEAATAAVQYIFSGERQEIHVTATHGDNSPAQATHAHTSGDNSPATSAPAASTGDHSPASASRSVGGGRGRGFWAAISAVAAVVVAAVALIGLLH